jgi:formylglycine-generating enzyme required for sulfatase activity
MRYPTEIPTTWVVGVVLVLALTSGVAAGPTMQGQSDQLVVGAVRSAEAPLHSDAAATGVAEVQAPSGPSVAGRTFRDCEDCPEMVEVPAGKFMMGWADGDQDEKPAHEVVIAKPFAVSKFEVTLDEYAACVADDVCAETRNPWYAGARGRRPVIDIAWYDARNYVTWLSQKTGKSYRLLSEAEWEYAARAGTTTKYAFGDTITHDQANFSAGKQGEGRTVQVGSYPPNAWGLHDMHGNVWEWVEDCYHFDYTRAPADGTALFYPGCATRVLRGGSWDYEANEIRSSTRFALKPLMHLDEVGLRVARSLE